MKSIEFKAKMKIYKHIELTKFLYLIMMIKYLYLKMDTWLSYFHKSTH